MNSTPAAESAEAIYQYFTTRYGAVAPPAPARSLASAEARIGVPLPEILRELYRRCNGLRGPLNAQYLLPLSSRSELSLVSLTKEYEDDHRIKAPNFVWFGMSHADKFFALRALPDSTIVVVRMYPSADYPTEMGNDLFKAFLADEAEALAP